MRLRNWLRGSISCRFVNGATYGAWGTLCSLRTRKRVGKEDLFVCLSLYSYSSLKPNDFSKGFMEAPVQVGTLSPGPPGSGGRRADRAASPGQLLTWGHHTVPHGSRHNNILSQPRGTNPSVQIFAFPHTCHMYTHESTFSYTNMHV